MKTIKFENILLWILFPYFILHISLEKLINYIFNKL